VKKVLMISQAFPPIGHVASKRAGCLAKYLREYGWEPVVLAQQWMGSRTSNDVGDNCFYDPDFVVNLPADLTVIRVPVTDYAPGSPAWVVDLARRVFLPHHRPYPFWRNGQAVLPQILKEHEIKAVWATAPWACSHLLGAEVARRADCPWIADFRDIIGQVYENPLTSAINPIRLLHQSRYLKTATAVIAATHGFAERLEIWHGRPVHVMFNGFDPDDFASDPAPQIDRFRILYTGCLTSHGRPNFRPLLDALQSLIEAGEMEADRVSLDFYGANNEQALAQMVEGHSVRRLVSGHEAVGRAECIALQRSAAVLLQSAFPRSQGWVIPAKLFEYLSARRPILAVPGDGGGVDNILRETGAGVSAATAADLAPILKAWYDEWCATGSVLCRADEKAIAKYSRKEHARRLARLLDECASMY
jgi:glycosyltransferase involved in cell wall biosynthesis